MWLTFEKIAFLFSAPGSVATGFTFDKIVLIATALGSMITGIASMLLVHSSKKQVNALLKQVESSARQADASFALMALSKQQIEASMEQFSSNQKDTRNHKVLSVASDLIACFEEFRLGIKTNYGKIIGLQKELQLLLNCPDIVEITERMRIVIDQKKGDWNKQYFDLEKILMHEIATAIQ
jgi:hypothetical protein